MKLKTLYVRFYKSFNYDYLRKSHPKAEPDPWDILPGDDALFYPFVRIPLEPGITTVVGANESGKSQLLTAIKCLLTGSGIAERDFCRYSEFFTVGETMLVPEFGGEFCDLDDAEVGVIRTLAGLDPEQPVDSFCFFRANSGPALYVLQAEGWTQVTKFKVADVKKLTLPTYFVIDANTPLPDSVPISYLTASDKTKKARPRKKVLGWIEKLIENHDWFGSKESIDENVKALIEEHAQFDLEDVDDEYFLKRLELAEKLLLQVAGIGKEAFKQLSGAVKSHDGYANAIVAKMNSELSAALNFPKWWSQDSEFSLALTLRDFDLVLTVRDRTGSEYAFSERSGGMSYFLSYFVQYLSHRPTGGQEILLMDEPDAYLSMMGQQDLLKIFASFAEPSEANQRSVQVIYVTHSPFLIDKNHSERIRVLEKGDGEEGTRHVANAGRNHYEPLRSAFGAFVAETTFISNCNLMLEGQADQVLLAGISSLARRFGTTGQTLDLNRLSLVPSGSAEHIPYMVYLARGRDVDTPAVVVLLDGDDEGKKIADELHLGYRDRRYVDDEFVIRTSDISMGDVSVATNAIREIEDLIPADLAVLAIHRYAEEVFSPEVAGKLQAALPTLAVPAGEKLYKTAENACAALTPSLRLDKVGFARAVLACLEDAPDDLRDTTIGNFEQLFALLVSAQRDAVRKNGREKTRRTITRFNRAFFRDHKSGASRAAVTDLLEDIESQLSEVTEETEEIRASIRMIRADFKLKDEPASQVADFEELREALDRLPNVGVLAAQE
jgi:predicted ATPase